MFRVLGYSLNHYLNAIFTFFFSHQGVFGLPIYLMFGLISLSGDGVT